MVKPRIVKVARCIFAGPKAILMAYDEDGKELIGIPIKTENVHQWARTGVTKKDRERLQKALDEWHEAGAAESAAK